MKQLPLITAAVTTLTLAASAQDPAKQQVGSLPGGGFLLNSGWTIRPAGTQVPVDTLPMSTAASRDGKYLFVLNGGYSPPSISVIDLGTKKEIGRTELPDAWLGLTVAPDKDLIYVGGGTTGKVFELALDATKGTLTRTREFAAVKDLNNKGNGLIGDVELSPDAAVLYAADLYGDSVAVIGVQSGKLIDRWKTGRRPYRIVISPSGRQVLVSAWGDGSVYQHNAMNGTELGRTRIGPHPTDMLWINRPAPSQEGGSSYPARLFVTAGNTNNVYSLGVTADGQLTALETINLSLTPMHPLGMTPSALATDERGSRLFVVCSDANAVAVADIASARTKVLGFIPTGWYPTAVRTLGNDQLVIVNGKGLGSRANPHGPNPTMRPETAHKGPIAPPTVEYVAHIQTGTVGFVPVPSEPELAQYTRTVLEGSPYRDEMVYGPITDEQEGYFSRTQGHESPIKHLIYIIKENRTYDQVLGDMAKGNGDKSLNLFGEKITPNLHELAREYILYDNFYENADVSADGHNWASAAIAPDFTMKLWPNNYGHRDKTYAFEGGEPANTPPAGYLWDNALQSGLTVRDYGEWVSDLATRAGPGERQIREVRDPMLAQHTDMNFRSFDLEYRDVDRAKEFIKEWQQFEQQGDAPQLTILRLGNDHTEGTRPGAWTPFVYVADNDYALGMVVEAVSHGNFWGSTAIFAIEDDAQNGPDHVDSHRAPVWVISPYTRRGVVDSTMYNQTSVLRTIEGILGLHPMTHFDAGARPMFGSFRRDADTKAYTAIAPKISLNDRNPAHGPGAEASRKMDFSEADLADDDELNDVLWRAIKHSKPPAPVRSAFAP
ncbi:MAG: bifunctional YncE family protein/alkaline phosphatase family protein [Acidobacteriaceae bacterium]|nr:bifunctional YncE family protein/alkaline phosphatase family protein [Acidobacteriaceae bacterium]